MKQSRYKESLRKNYPEFREKCVSWMSKHWQKNTHQVLLEGFYALNDEPEPDFTRWKEAVRKHEFQETILNPSLAEFYIRPLQWMTEPWGSASYHKVLNWRNSLEHACQNSFFTIETNRNRLSKLVKADFYPDGMLNTDAWWNFIKGLVNHHFDSFSEVVTTGNDRVCVLERQIFEKCTITLELSRADIRSELSNNEPDLPPVKIYLDDLPSEEKRASGHKHNRLYLGILGNPLIFPPCYPLKVYSAIVRVDKIGEIYHVRHPKDFIGLLSERSFFYTALLKETSSAYLDYLCKCAVESL